MDRRHSPSRAASGTMSSIVLDFNPLGQILSPTVSPTVSPVVKANSASLAKAKNTPVVMNNTPSRNPYHISPLPTPPASPPRKPFRISPLPTPPVKKEQLVLPVKAPTSSSPAKPAKISPAKPKTPIEIPTAKPKPKFSLFNRIRIQPVSNTETAPVATINIVPNKSLGLPDKLLAIYYVGLIYDAIKGLALEIKELVKKINQLKYIYHPIFDKDALGKLEELIKDIEMKAYMYHHTKLNKEIDRKVSYLFVRYLITKPTTNRIFLDNMLEIIEHKDFKLLKALKKKHDDKLDKLERDGVSQERIRKMEDKLRKEYKKIYTKLEYSRVDYKEYIGSQKEEMFKKTLKMQNNGLTEENIKALQYISHKDFEKKLQSLNDTMNVFLGIVNNILNADVEPSRTEDTLSGGRIFFAEYRYNQDDKEYTPLVYRYIDANSKNFQYVLDYFIIIFKYFKKIRKKMVNEYKKEHINILEEYQIHPEYNKDAFNNALSTYISRYPTLATLATLPALAKNTIKNTDEALKRVREQLKNIRGDTSEKHFETKLNNMNNIIKKAQEETDKLYLKLA